MFFNLAAEIKRRGLTQKEFALQVGINEVLFSKKINSKTLWNLDEIKRILQFFANELSFDYLFFEESVEK